MQLQILGSATLTDVGSNTRTTLWKTSRISIALITFVLQIFPTADTEAVPKVRLEFSQAETVRAYDSRLRAVCMEIPAKVPKALQ